MRKLFNGAGPIFIAVIMMQPVPGLSSRNGLMAQTPVTESNIEVKVIKYDDLKEAVKERKGSLVVVDFWSTT